MQYPPFFDDVSPITLYDPLTALLGVNNNGEVTITYLDVVKLAGHSCPTTAGAFLMLREGLAALYPDTPPQRGDISVSFRQTADTGTTGVIAAVASLVTGASDDKGFKGMGGRFARNNRLFFGSDIPLLLRLMRRDNGTFVDIGYDPSTVPENPLMTPLKSRVLGGMATETERLEFGRLWQERVRKIVLEFDRERDVIVVKKGA
jgi:hypothetical protein